MLRTDSQRARSTGELSSEPSSHAMHHSHSTPAGVDGGIRTPPPTPKKAGKMLAVKVVPLHDNSTIFQIQAKALGRVLFDQVCKQLNLLEADYFGLEYKDLSGTRYWLDLQKPLSRQVGLSLVEPELYFCVKFYTPDPGQLEEEFTRYLFCLQVKRDLAEGHLHCNDNTAALLASYLVQAECGDYASEDYPDHTYLSSYKFVPHQDHELECRIMENHKKHIGQSPAEADLNLLETARRCELYGMKMHPAKDHEGAALNLAVAHMGIVVFQHYSKINTFSWAKIRKISFKRKRFLIKLHPEGHGYYKDLVEFLFEGRDECKNFWKKCVEHHGFFRCSAVKNVSRHKTRVLSRGSSFRYSGKTQKQIVEFVRDNYVKRETHHRSASFRRSAPSSKANVHTKVVGNSISAHPLLPLADPSLAEEVASPRQGASEVDWGEGSQTTRVAFLHPDIATRSKESVSREATTSSPSPPRTTQSVQCADERAETSGQIYTNRQDPLPVLYAPKSEGSLSADDYSRRPRVRQRSVSCRDLFLAYGTNSTPLTAERFVPKYPIEPKLESPVTRYDESRKSLYEVDARHETIDQKIYSSSYPGTVTIGPKDPASYELAESQDDLSHDSYELLDDDVSPMFRFRNSYSNESERSGSLDSGNCVSDSEDERNFRSTSDAHDNIFMMDDPRDFPRETNPRKSDGSFYKTVKLSSRTSSLESKSDYYESTFSSKKLSKELCSGSGTSSLESGYAKPSTPPVHDTDINECLEFHDISVKKYNTDVIKTTRVHSVSLQNVDTEQNIRNNQILSSELHTVPRTQKTLKSQTNPTWSETVCALSKESFDNDDKNSKPEPVRNSPENIFSFDDDKIQEIQKNDFLNSLDSYPPILVAVNPLDISLEHTLSSSAQNLETDVSSVVKKTEAELITDLQTHPTHPPIERTKSDPNTITNRQRLGMNSRRYTLMHQKSIDLTPADSSDEDFIYRQIPSAPPISKSLANRFEMPTAEFGHFDILHRDFHGQRTNFEVPKSQFEIIGAKTQFDLIKLPPKDNFDIPYILHKRHIINGTATKIESKDQPPVKMIEPPVEKHPSRRSSQEVSPCLLKSPKALISPKRETVIENTAAASLESTFLFTQNVDLSHINPVTLEVDKNDLPTHHFSSPKHDITKIDPAVLETLNIKLRRIESDSPPLTDDTKVKPKGKTDIKSFPKHKYDNNKTGGRANNVKDKPKRNTKQRIQSNKKSIGNKNKGKIRITSFSSDDESLDSDDVFGCSEAMPTKLEFSPPQSRKEMESILKFESERQSHLQYTMSSTEIEGSPPQCRKTEVLPFDRSLEPQHTELRRISERSISIPSSEEDVRVSERFIATVEKQGGSEANDHVFVDEKLDLPLSVPISTEESVSTLPEKSLDKPTITSQKEFPTTTIEKTQAAYNLCKNTDLVDPVIEQPIQKSLSTAGMSKEVKLKTLLANADAVLLRRGQSAGLFAHARLHLSEGSGLLALQRQSAVQSMATRKTKSLDTAVVSVSSLPPPDAFSSKDDTVDSNDGVDESSDPDQDQNQSSDNKDIDEQIVPSISLQGTPQPDVDTKNTVIKPIEHNGDTIETKSVSTEDENCDKKTENSKTIKLKPLTLTKPPKKRSDSDKRSATKEKSKSFEKLELKRISSKERSKSQDDNELSSAKRKEKQQMLYETAIKQTKTLKSPVKEMLPPFPIVEDSVSVSDGKLEIKIDVADFVIPDDAIIITKSPKKLDKKWTKSLELNFTDSLKDDNQMYRLGKSLDLECEKKREYDSCSKPITNIETWDTSDETSDIESDEIAQDNLDSAAEISPPCPLENNIKKLSPILPDEPLLTVDGREYMYVKKLSAERSKSEETTSWITVACDEVIGELSPNDLPESGTAEVVEPPDIVDSTNKNKMLKLSDTRSDTTGSWTSGDAPQPNKEVKSGDESSVSCAIVRALGISQHIEQYDSREELENKIPPTTELEITVQSPRSPLRRTSPVEEEPVSFFKKPLLSTKTDSKSSTDTSSLASFEAAEKIIKNKYPFEQKWLSDAERNQFKTVSGQSSADEPSDRPSVDTESSSGSLGAAIRMQKSGEAPPLEPSSTWRPFLMESSGSSSLEDGILPPDYDFEDKEYYLGRDIYLVKPEEEEIKSDTSILFNASCLPSMTEMFSACHATGNFLGRTLSRISERSSASEKSSLEDTSKNGTQYDSTNEEFSDPQGSLSSEGVSDGIAAAVEKKRSSSHSTSEKMRPSCLLGAHLQRQISDDRRTSAEMADISLDDVDLIMSDDAHDDSEKAPPTYLQPSSSQESEDWPLPEIPIARRPERDRSESIDDASSDSSVFMIPDTSKTVPKVFGLRDSLRSEDSGQWPSPPSSGVFDPPYVENIHTYYMQPEEACKVIMSPEDKKKSFSSDEDISSFESTTVKSVGASLSDFSNTLNTVMFQNLTKNTKTEDTSYFENLSLSEWSNSNSHQLSCDISSPKTKSLPEDSQFKSFTKSTERPVKIPRSTLSEIESGSCLNEPILRTTTKILSRSVSCDEPNSSPVSDTDTDSHNFKTVPLIRLHRLNKSSCGSLKSTGISSRNTNKHDKDEEDPNTN